MNTKNKNMNMLELNWLDHRSPDDGPRTIRITESEMQDPIVKAVVTHRDPLITDLIGLFLSQYRRDRGFGVDSEEKLLAEEARYLEDTKEFCTNALKWEWHGSTCTASDLYAAFNTVWLNDEYLGDLDVPAEVGEIIARLGYSPNGKRTVDAEELLFWSFRLCGWWGFSNHLHYTLYKAITEGRFKRFYNAYSEELLLHFLTVDDIFGDDTDEDEPDERQ